MSFHRQQDATRDTQPWALAREVEDVAALRSLLADGKNDEAMRYNLTSVIGLPAAVVDGMAQAPWWAAMVAAAPTLVYDHAATHDITSTPTGAHAGPRSPCRRSCAPVT